MVPAATSLPIEAEGHLEPASPNHPLGSLPCHHALKEQAQDLTHAVIAIQWPPSRSNPVLFAPPKSRSAARVQHKPKKRGKKFQTLLNGGRPRAAPPCGHFFCRTLLLVCGTRCTCPGVERTARFLLAYSSSSSRLLAWLTLSQCALQGQFHRLCSPSSLRGAFLC